jgi:hypothetical protein
LHGLSGTRLAADADPARAQEIVQARAQDLTDGMNQTLQRMKQVLEAPQNSVAP